MNDARRLIGRLKRKVRRRNGAPVVRENPWLEAPLLDWGKHFLAEHFSRPPSAMHRWLAEQLATLHLERGTKINVIGPRGSAKSTLCTLAYVLRMACEAREPYVWIVSDTHEQATIHLENLKAELSDNSVLANAYPHTCGPGGRWRSAAIELINGVVVEAYGTGQRLRGRRRRSHRPSLIVCDDLQNDGHMISANQREGSRRWFHGTLLKAGTPETNILNLATALHRDALAMELLTTPGWRSRVFRAIQEWPERSDLWDQWEVLYSQVGSDQSIAAANAFYQEHRVEMNRGARLLWPEVEDLPTLMQMRLESGRTAFEREKQGSPVDPESCEWPEEYFGEEIWFAAWPAGLKLRVMALDPSKGASSRHGDFSAYVLLGITPDGTLLVEGDLARRPTPRMVADGVALYRRFDPALFGVEVNQWQELLADEFAAEFQRQGILGARPCGVRNYANKLVRIRRLGPYLSQRKIKFLGDSPSTRVLVDQLRDFPNGAHDDGPDALEMALRLAEEAWNGRSPATDGLGNRLIDSPHPTFM